jgi:hypothetical protein
VRWILIAEALALLGIVCLVVGWRRAGTLRSRKLSLVVAAYVSLVAGTAFRLCATSMSWRLSGELISLALLPVTYFLLQALTRRPAS